MSTIYLAIPACAGVQPSASTRPNRLPGATGRCVFTQRAPSQVVVLKRRFRRGKKRCPTYRRRLSNQPLWEISSKADGTSDGSQAEPEREFDRFIGSLGSLPEKLPAEDAINPAASSLAGSRAERIANRVRAIASNLGTDELMELLGKGQRAVLSSFLGQSILLLLVGGSMVLFTSYIYQLQTESSSSEALYAGLAFVLDPAQFADEDSPEGRLIGLTGGIFGLLFVSVLIGIVSEFITEAMESMGEGVQNVEATGHTLVLNWNNNCGLLIQELCAGFESEQIPVRSRVIVVLANMERAEMLRVVENEVRELYSSEIVVLNDDPSRLENLQRLSIGKASRVVLVSPTADPLANDVSQVNLLTLVHGVMADSANALVQLRRLETERAVKSRFPRARPITLGNAAAYLTTQTLIEPGLSLVWTDLISFTQAKLCPITIPSSVATFNYSVLIDILKDIGIPLGVVLARGPNQGKLCLMPEDSFAVQGNDVILVVATCIIGNQNKVQLTVQESAEQLFTRISKECLGVDDCFVDNEMAYRECIDDEECIITPDLYSSDKGVEKLPDDEIIEWDPAEWLRATLRTGSEIWKKEELYNDASIVREDSIVKRSKGCWLVCGWRLGMDAVLRSLNDSLEFGSEVHILADIAAGQRDKMLSDYGLDLDYMQTIRVLHFEGSVLNEYDIKQLPVMEYAGVLFLKGTDATVGSLNMQNFMLANGMSSDCQMVAEIEGLPSDSLMDTSLEVVSNEQLDTLTSAMISIYEPIYQLLQQLLSPSGAKIITIPASRLAKEDDLVSFQQIQARGRAKGGTLMGFFGPDQPLVLNPPDKVKKRLWKGITMVLLWDEDNQTIDVDNESADVVIDVYK